MLTRELFEKWLLDMNPEDHAGTIKNGGSCPIATCLTENGAEVVSVGGTASYRIHGSKDRITKNEPWILSFVTNIDTLSVLPVEEQDKVEANHGSVDAATCLKTLRSKC